MIRGRIVTPASTAVKRGYTRKPAPSGSSVKMCSHCGINPRLKDRLVCATCHGYQAVHKRKRPAHLIQRAIERRGRPKLCKVCDSLGPVAAGRCSACYWYLANHRQERPRWLWDKDFRCIVCGYPKHAARGLLFHKEKCNACRAYKLRTGNERPKTLWGDGAYGFCDCGYPAEHKHDGFSLCNRCFGEATR